MRRALTCLLPLLLVACAPSRTPPPVGEPLEITMPEPDARQPVSAAAAAEPGRCGAGEVIDVVVVARIARGWHIYPIDHTVGPEIPTSLRADVPVGAQWTDRRWRVEREEGSGGGAGSAGGGAVYEGTVRFIRPLRVGGDARGITSIPIRFTFEACDAFSCHPPATVTLVARVDVVPR